MIRIIYVKKSCQRFSNLFLLSWGAFLLAAVLSGSFSAPTEAATGINEKINYQARLLTSTGATVPDGQYNIEFKIYQDGAGCEVSGTPPCGGTLKWTETRTGADRVTVRNGYFSVAMGSVTPFGTSVDWNQDTLWLSLNIGGPNVTPVWDGEMVPFRRLAAAVYALNTKQLGGLDWTKFVQIAPAAVQTDTSILSTLFINKTGASGNILQLQKSGVDTFTLANEGAVTFQNTTDSTTAFRILTDGAVPLFVADTTNSRAYIGNPTADAAGALLVLDTKNDAGDPTGVNGGMYYNSSTGKFRCFQASAWTDCVGVATLQTAYDAGNTVTTTTGRNVLFTMPDVTTDPSFLINLQCDTCSANGGRFAVQDDGTDVFTINPGGGSASFINLEDSTIGFEVLNGSGIPMFTIDTTNSQIELGNQTADGTGAILILDTKNTAGDPTGSNGGIYYNSATGKFRCYENSVWNNCIDSARAGFHLIHDMLLDTTGDDISLINTGTTGAANDEGGNNGVAGHPGIVSQQTGTIATGGATAYGGSGGASGILLGNTDIWMFESVLRIPTLSDGTNRFQVRSGFKDSAFAEDVDGCFLKYGDNVNTGKWQGVCRSNSVESVCDTTITVAANTWYRLTVTVNAAGNSTDFQINGVSRCQVTTNIPIGAGRGTTFMSNIVKTLGTTNRTVDLDYIEVVGQLGTPR